jgi:hypothetical protein
VIDFNGAGEPARSRRAPARGGRLLRELRASAPPSTADDPRRRLAESRILGWSAHLAPRTMVAMAYE